MTSLFGPNQWQRRVGRCPQGCATPQVAPLDEALGVQPHQRTSGELQENVMMDEATNEALYQHWTHSHEEDTPTERVFRPATYSFPRSRGRFSFELNRDGTVVFQGIGPTDRPESALGVWKREGDRLAVYSNPATDPDQVLEIV